MIKCLLLAVFICCTVTFLKGQSVSLKEKAIKEIIAAENAFEKMAAEKGLAEAFWFYAAEDAVIKRSNDSLIYGKEGIRHFYSKEFYEHVTLKWAPDFADASDNGDMGYTYGKYLWKLKGPDGKTDESRGVFHTVWKKQKDGSWKFVWD